jgi:hypothetical protein
VIEGKPELVLGGHKARDAMTDGHTGILPTAAASATNRASSTAQPAYASLT